MDAEVAPAEGGRLGPTANRRRDDGRARGLHPRAPQISALSDVATSEVVVLDRQVTRAEMAECVLGRVPGVVSVAGHSLGGWVAQEIAARAPEGVSALFQWL